MSTSVPCASLYVGDLHPDVTEAILYDKFNEYGTVLSIRVCRDLVTRKSLGYAYVNYQTPEEAKLALDNLNFEDIFGRSCRIMWSQRDPATRRSGVGNIFIKNLDPSITVKEINDTFSNFGEITSCKLQTDESGNSKGFAFVNFNKAEDAERAIDQINGKIIREKLVYVAKFIPRNQRTTHSKEYTNCYIKNFDTLYDDERLKSLFGEYGEIVSAKVMVDRDNKSKGFGFVSFREHEQAKTAVEKLNGMIVEGRSLFVGPAMKKAERQRELKSKHDKLKQERMQQHKSGVNLYIKNLGNEIDDERLKEEFKGYGNITSAKVMLNKENNTSKGFGFVCFSAPDEATKAVSEMNGKIVDGKPLYVALAQKKEDRVAHLRTQFAQRIPNNQPTFVNPNMVQLMNFSGARNLPINRPANMINTYNRAPYMPFGRNNYLMPSGPQNMPPTRQNQPRINLQNVNSIDLQRMNANSRPITNRIAMNPGPNMNQQRNMVFQYGDNMMSQGQHQHVMSEQPEKQELAGDLSNIVNASNQEAKQMLGEKIYPLVCRIAGEHAGKITGMFLELENTELVHMIENEASLKMKIEEAMLVLNTHNQNVGSA